MYTKIQGALRLWREHPEMKQVEAHRLIWVVCRYISSFGVGLCGDIHTFISYLILFYHSSRRAAATQRRNFQCHCHCHCHWLLANIRLHLQTRQHPYWSSLPLCRSVFTNSIFYLFCSWICAKIRLLLSCTLSHFSVIAFCSLLSIAEIGSPHAYEIFVIEF